MVVVYLHWGRELQGCPTPEQRTAARALADAGADVVVGSVTPLGSGWTDDTYVNYGLGNFLWYHNHQPDTGVLRLRIENGDVVRDNWVPARIQPLGRVLPLHGADRTRAVSDWRGLRACCTDLASSLPVPTGLLARLAWAGDGVTFAPTANSDAGAGFLTADAQDQAHGGCNDITKEASMHSFPAHPAHGRRQEPTPSRVTAPHGGVTASIAAAVLALPLAVGAVVAPVSAATARPSAVTPTAGPGWQQFKSPYAPYTRPAAVPGGSVRKPDHHRVGRHGRDSGAVHRARAHLHHRDFGAGEAAGTGMVIDSSGIVVTNHHVVEGATDIEVTIASTGDTYAAEVLGTDATADVAVLRLDDAAQGCRPFRPTRAARASAARSPPSGTRAVTDTCRGGDGDRAAPVDHRRRRQRQQIACGTSSRSTPTSSPAIPAAPCSPPTVTSSA